MKNGRLIISGIAAFAVLALAGTAVAHSVVRIKGTMQDDVITGTAGHDYIVALAGDDTVNAGDDGDRVFGNRGDDTLNGEGGNDRLIGGPGEDGLSGAGGSDLLRGRHGSDALDGGHGNDRMWPGAGADTQTGGAGDDRLHALARDNAKDTLDCGPGNDTAVLNVDETLDTTVNCERIMTVTITNTAAEAAEQG